MIDKVQLSIRMIFIVSFAILALGCSVDRPLKQPVTSNQTTIIKSYSSKTDKTPLQCSDKKTAILHIGMERPKDSQHFPRLQELITKRLLQRSQLDRAQHFRDATHILLQPQQVSLLGKVDRDMKSQIREIGQLFDSQIIVNGSISKIEISQSFIRNKNGEDYYLDNISGVINNMSDKLSGISWRKVFFKLQLFDSYSGDLIIETETEHKISLKSGRPSFLLARFSDNEKYEKQMINAIDSLVSSQIKIINDFTFCTFLRDSVITTDNVTATINVGEKSQVRVGDQFGLFQSRLLHTDLNGAEHLLEEKVGTLRITRVQSDSATGQIENLSRTTEIHRGDLVIRTQ